MTSETIKEHDTVVLTRDAPEAGLVAGDMVVVVHIYPRAEAYEVEIFAADGQTIDVVSLPADAVRLASAREVPHVRPVAAE